MGLSEAVVSDVGRSRIRNNSANVPASMPLVSVGSRNSGAMANKNADAAAVKLTVGSRKLVLVISQMAP